MPGTASNGGAAAGGDSSEAAGVSGTDPKIPPDGPGAQGQEAVKGGGAGDAQREHRRRKEAALAILRRPRGRGRPSNAEYEARDKAERELTYLGVTDQDLAALGIPGFSSSKDGDGGGGPPSTRQPEPPSSEDAARDPRPPKPPRSGSAAVEQAEDPAASRNPAARAAASPSPGPGGGGGTVATHAPPSTGRAAPSGRKIGLLSAKRLRAQQQQAAHEAAKLAVAEAEQCEKDLMSLVQPSAGPYLVVQPSIEIMYGPELVNALRCGQKERSSWGLNVLTWLSFDARQEMHISRCPGVLDALLKILDAWHGVKMSGKKRKGEATERSQFAPPVGSVRVRVGPLAEERAEPGSANGWWWEKEELLSEEEGRGQQLQQAVCVSNILRNLSFVRENERYLAGAAVISSLVACIEDSRPTYDCELAENALECARNVGVHVDFGSASWKAGVATGRRMLEALCGLLRGGRPRDRVLASETLSRLATQVGNGDALRGAMSELRLLGALVDALGEGYDDETRAAAACAVFCMVQVGGEEAARRLVGERQAVRRVVGLLTGMVREGGVHAARVLASLAGGGADGRAAVLPFEAKIAEAAMQDTPHSDLLAGILAQMCCRPPS